MEPRYRPRTGRCRIKKDSSPPAAAEAAPAPSVPATAGPAPLAPPPAPAAAMHADGGDHDDHSPTEKGPSDSHPSAPEHTTPPRSDPWSHPDRPPQGQQQQPPAPDDTPADTTEAIPDANASNAYTSGSSVPSRPSLTGHHYSMDDLTDSMQSVDSDETHSSMDDLADAMGEL